MSYIDVWEVTPHRALHYYKEYGKRLSFHVHNQAGEQFELKINDVSMFDPWRTCARIFLTAPIPQTRPDHRVYGKGLKVDNFGLGDTHQRFGLVCLVDKNEIWKAIKSRPEAFAKHTLFPHIKRDPVNSETIPEHLRQSLSLYTTFGSIGSTPEEITLLKIGLGA